VLLQAKAGNNVYQFSFNPTDPAFTGTFDWQHATPVLFVGKGAFDSFNPASAHLGILAPGDANADGITDFNDLVALAQNYNTSNDPTWSTGDFTGDGIVDFNDLVLLAQTYNQVASAPPVGVEGAGSAVPEPGLITLAAILGCASIVRRRGRFSPTAASRRRLMIFFVALGLVGISAVAPSARAAPVAAFAYTGATTETFNGGFTSVGYQFTTSSPLSVSALGIFDHNGTDISAAGWDVGIYTTDASHALLTSTTVKSSDATTTPAGGGANVFRYHSLATPVILPAGTYMLASMDPSGAFDKNATGLSTGAGLGTITIGHATFTGLGMGGQPLAFPDTNFDPNLPGNFGPNFLASAVPEPASITLFLSSGVMLVALRRRRKS
jgi:hypothetical protein